MAAVLATVVGGAGHFRFAVLVIGLAVLAVALTGSRGAAAGDGRRRAAVLLQAGVGTGLTTVGALIAVPVGSERTVSTLHAAVLVLGSAGLCAVTSRSGGGAADGLELDTPEGLGAALGRALDREPVVIALPKGDGTWLDAGGRRVEPSPDQRPWRAADGALLARLSDPGDLDRQQRRALDRLLAAAVHGARLRADLRERAAALDASRGRLLTAAADERARLATLIERGPLARLDRLDGLTSLVREDPVLATRRDAARTALGSVRRGLDPTAPGLELALRALADDSRRVAAGRVHLADCRPARPGKGPRPVVRLRRGARERCQALARCAGGGGGTNVPRMPLRCGFVTAGRVAPTQPARAWPVFRNGRPRWAVGCGCARTRAAPRCRWECQRRPRIRGNPPRRQREP